MSDPNSSPTLTSVPATVGADLSCRKCQYNLRGLLVESRCPECGSPVTLSTRGDSIMYSDPSWIGRLHFGVVVILCGLGVMIAGTGFRALNLNLRIVDYLIPQTVISSSSFIVALGYWFLTTPDPSGIGEDIYGKSRRIVRLTVSIGLIDACWMAIEREASLPPVAAIITAFGVTVCGAVGLVGNIAELHFLSKLAMRIPDLKLHDIAKFLRYWLGIPLVIVYSVAWTIRLQFFLGLPAARGPLKLVAGFTMLFVFIFGAKYLLTLNRFRKQFKAQRQIAAESWTSKAVPSV